MSNFIREANVIGIKTCLEIAKACKNKAEIIKELELFLKEQQDKL